MNHRLYHYVGPEEIRRRKLLRAVERACIQHGEDLRHWIARTQPIAARRSYVPATYIIDPQQQLWVADRHSEHVACAGGGDVLAAGEMVFAEHRGRIEVVDASNQSLGYCPEPSCWSVVAVVLDRLQLLHPPQFTGAFEFRRCGRCGQTNLIKDGVFECAVCQAELSKTWNYDRATKDV